jgi:hypothetical protein
MLSHTVLLSLSLSLSTTYLLLYMKHHHTSQINQSPAYKTQNYKRLRCENPPDPPRIPCFAAPEALSGIALAQPVSRPVTLMPCPDISIPIPHPP